MTTLTGKKALVTGVGSETGLGLAIAKQLQDAGAKVYIVDYNPVVKEIGEKHGFKALNADITSPEIGYMLDEFLGEYGVDILISNAGTTRDAALKKMTVEMFDKVIDVNLKPTWVLSKHLGLKMAARGWGRIVSTSSIIGLTGNFGQTNYAASKAGLIGLTKSLAYEFARKGVTVNAVAPGFIETDMTAGMKQEALDDQASKIPVQRLGNPEDIANGVSYLVSPGASYVTGETLSINGGLAMY